MGFKSNLKAFITSDMGLANVCNSSNNASRAFSGTILIVALLSVPLLGEGIGFGGEGEENKNSG